MIIDNDNLRYSDMAPYVSQVYVIATNIMIIIYQVPKLELFIFSCRLSKQLTMRFILSNLGTYLNAPSVSLLGELIHRCFTAVAFSCRRLVYAHG